MLLIEHRVNTVEKLRATPTHWGVEVDVRDYDGALRLAHDPYEGGERLEDFLAAYRHALIIFNVKSAGLEGEILALVDRFGIRDYFFLDVSNPALVTLARAGNQHVAVRFSEYEPAEFAMAFAGQVEWLWVDCFETLPLDRAAYERLHPHFKICLVSPELQGHARSQIRAFREQLAGLPIEAVCSDFCADWEAPL